VETDGKKTTRKTKEQMGRWHKEWHKNLKIKNWTNCIQDRKKKIGNYMLRRSKHWKIEAVAPKEEEEEEEEEEEAEEEEEEDQN
jgi:hypothetical protein